MMKFEWTDNYSVLNDEIDNHHKRLIGLFNQVGELIEKDKNTPLFSSIKVISELNVYAIFHFKEEEKLMEVGHYPNIEEHKKIHKEFIQQVQKFKSNYLENDPLVNYEIFNYLSDWILQHIAIEDSKYKEYI